MWYIRVQQNQKNVGFAGDISISVKNTSPQLLYASSSKKRGFAGDQGKEVALTVKVWNPSPISLSV